MNSLYVNPVLILGGLGVLALKPLGAFLLTAERRKEREEKVNKIAEKLNLSKHVEVRASNGRMTQGCCAMAHGNSFLGKAGIVLEKESTGKLVVDSDCLDDDAREFVYAHEIAHIKNNDLIKLNATFFIVAIAVLTLGINAGLPVLPTVVLTCVVAKLVSSFVSRRCEMQADIDAVKALKKRNGAIKFLERLPPDSEGGLFDLHPTPLDRKKRIQDPLLFSAS